MGFVIGFAVITAHLLGLALGVVVCYIYAYKPLQSDYKALIDKMLYMRKQGFVPQFEIEQRQTPDPAADIREF